jgi:hypothetical protein
MALQLPLIDPSDEVDTLSRLEREIRFCEQAPHRQLPYSRRDWGGALHSLCSYQGKLKPAIAHFLVSWFTQPGDVILDPLAGVGTIPLEARRLGRVGIAGDLSPLAVAVSRSKLEPFVETDVWDVLTDLQATIEAGLPLEDLERDCDTNFGLNGPIKDYFHPDTLREVLIARGYFSPTLRTGDYSAAYALVAASVLHILHGNRPYALSRRSHPVTPFAPTGPAEYRSLIDRVKQRLARVLPELLTLTANQPAGRANLADFREIRSGQLVDTVITSPPFSQSLRFWSSNWMRLWFAGWQPEDFKTEPAHYLETEQRNSYSPYREFAEAMANVLKPNGLLVMHLGETKRANMAARIIPEIADYFNVEFHGRESVEDTESHGLSDKGSTIAHHYLFARNRSIHTPSESFVRKNEGRTSGTHL